MIIGTFSALARADNTPSIPISDPTYSNAINHAKDAFLSQIGFTDLENKTAKYMKTTYVDQYSWTKQFSAAVGGGYMIYKRRRIEIPLCPCCNASMFEWGSGLTIHF
jgi:hypothetical protein